MTAIFAFATDDTAFVAADTLRNHPLFGQVNAIKVHEWSDRVVPAQAGDGKFQSQLISEMKLAKPLLDFAHPSLAEDQRLITAFTSLQPNFYAKALSSVSKLASGAAHTPGPVPAGTLIAGMPRMSPPAPPSPSSAAAAGGFRVGGTLVSRIAEP